MFKKILVIFLFLSTSNLLYSQITISSPVVRQVFQRGLNNQATITITGSYSQPIDTIQVRFTSVKAGQGTDVPWTVIKSAPLGGLFKGSVNVKGGWYTMDVRGLLNGKQVGNISNIERVGVGEVFVIAGQSNAGGTGERAINETAATDDRVNCANFINAAEGYWKQYDPTNTSFKVQANTYNFSIVDFSQLKKTASIGPMGLGPFYWGKVGDALAAKLNVPIMFFNVAFAGSSVRVWKESAENPTIGAVADTQPFLPIINRYDVGTPYANLKEVLGYYGVNLGVRAVLWMQGETDNVIILRDNPNLVTYEAQYQANLEALIKKTRQDFGNNKLSWVIARTSYSGQLGCGASPTNLIQKPSPIVASAQNKVISNSLNAPIYPGPFTDNIQIPRESTAKAECVHFTGTGLDEVANAWVKSLTEDNKNFFETVEPIMADTIPSISLDCISGSQLKLTLPDGYSSYSWVNKSTQQSYTTKSIIGASGIYTARVTRTNGNIIQIPDFTVKTNTPPLAPTVKALSDVNFCLGSSVTLQGATEADNPIYQWISSPAIANLPRTKDISASREGTYNLRVIDKNACASPYSADVKLVAKTRPEKPVIATSGSTEFCDGQSIVLTSSNVGAANYVWSNGEKTQSITVKKAGTYNVQTIGTNGCPSQFSTDNITIVVNPLPSVPQIRALSDTVFCDGGSVSLVSTPSDNSSKFGWNRNNTVNNTDISSTIKVSGTELVKGFVIDSKGCNSPLSNAIQVVKKDNPKAITVIQKGVFILEARADKRADKYTWKLNDKIVVSEDSATISTRKYGEGGYSVIGKNVYKIRSSTNDLNCFSAESEKFNYNYQISENKGINIYPNPSLDGILTIERLYSYTDGDTFQVYTVDGKFLYDKSFTNFIFPQKLDLSFLKTGNYILRSVNSGIVKRISIVR